MLQWCAIVLVARLTRADDIQGTAAVSLACFISAIERSGVPVEGHRFVFFGAGSAAIGIAQLMCEHLVKAGLSEQDARERFWLVDSKVRLSLVEPR